jgi:hypothetical protein
MVKKLEDYFSLVLTCVEHEKTNQKRGTTKVCQNLNLSFNQNPVPGSSKIIIL